DLNWDVAAGAPSFVTEAPSDEIARDPSRLAVFMDYVHNIVGWLAAGTEPRQLSAGLRAVEELLDEHLPYHCNLIRIDADTWAIHGSIAVSGDVILAEFTDKEQAEAALRLLWAAGASAGDAEQPR